MRKLHDQACFISPSISYILAIMYKLTLLILSIPPLDFLREIVYILTTLRGG